MHIRQPTTSPSQPAQSQPPASCPVRSSPSSSSPHDSSASTLSKLNPLNYMPSNLSQSRHANQSIPLPCEREISSIPKGDQDGNWEYPSPQQMYNAMLRKGYDDTPTDAVESWAEIEAWERRFSRGLRHGWQICRRGEGAFDDVVAQDRNPPVPRLVRFQGRPRDLTPKARVLQALGWVAPSKFG